MDRVPPKLPNTSSRLIAMAVSLVGNVEAVRKSMDCSEADFQEYCASQKEPPWEQFDRLIQLIIREQGLLIAKTRELLTKIHEKKDQT